MTKKPARVTKPVGFDPNTDDTASERQSGEAAALAPRNMHEPRRKHRTAQWGVKTTPFKRSQHERLCARMNNKSMTEVYEEALDALEDKLNRESD